MRRKVFRVVTYVIGAIGLLFLALYVYLLIVSNVSLPKPDDLSALQWQRQLVDSGLYRINSSWLRKSESGLYEMYVEGAPFERGVTIGKLTKELAQYQEEVFVNQLYEIVPSRFK